MWLKFNRYENFVKWPKKKKIIIIKSSRRKGSSRAGWLHAYRENFVKFWACRILKNVENPCNEDGWVYAQNWHKCTILGKVRWPAIVRYTHTHCTARRRHQVGENTTYPIALSLHYRSHYAHGVDAIDVRGPGYRCARCRTNNDRCGGGGTRRRFLNDRTRIHLTSYYLLAFIRTKSGTLIRIQNGQRARRYNISTGSREVYITS